MPTSQPNSHTGVEGVISLWPAAPGPIRKGGPTSKPFRNAEFVVTNDKGAVVASFTTDEKGQFRVSLPPGHYTVSKKEIKGRIGHYGPFEVDVAAGKMTRVEWQCDTGMR